MGYKYIDKPDHAHVCGHMCGPTFMNILTFYDQQYCLKYKDI